MKKKLVTGALLCAFGAVAVTGGTLAYFTDKDAAANEFTVGNVQIDLIEKDADLVTDFTNDQVLMPGSSTANEVAKRAWIENTGANEAWVWALVKIPSALDNPEDASKNSLHVNNYGYFTTEYHSNAKYAATPIADGILKADGTHAIANMVDPAEEHLWSDLDFVKTETIDNVEYNVYVTKMQGKLQPGENTLPFLRQVYMDSKVKQCEDANCTVEPGHYVLPNGTHYAGDWNVLVDAYAIQDAEFANVDAAYAAYDGE